MVTEEQVETYLRCTIGETSERCEKCMNFEKWDENMHCSFGPREAKALLTDRAELVAEVERLKAAAEKCRQYIGTGNATADFEAAAERFRRDTHMMAPGKSEPPGWNSRYTYDQRQMAWEAWLLKQKDDLRAALAALEGEATDE